MLKEIVTYEDFNGETQTEELHFNLMKHELTDLAFDLPQDVSDAVTNNSKEITSEEAAAKLVEKLGGKGVFQFIKELLLKAYGVKSEDGKRFIKNDLLRDEFAQSMAFDAMLDKLMSDDNKASDFVNAIIPSSLADKIPANKPAAKVKSIPAEKK